MQRFKRKKSSRTNRSASSRKGNAITEFALVAPLLALILLGGIDIGQAVNVSQVVNEASRHGARCASKAETGDVGDVENAIQEYVQNAFPSMEGDSVANAVSVNVFDDIGAVPGGDLDSIDSGGNVTVEVTIDYDQFRWMIGFAGLDGKSITTSTTMRRE